jgi:hypothetical protein
MINLRLSGFDPTLKFGFSTRRSMRRAAACRMGAGKILIVMFWIFFSVIPGGGNFGVRFRCGRASAAAKNLITAAVAIT